ncbi:sporulation histidine kinase inhibitor Sda [Virgibacillus flavescens]
MKFLDNNLLIDAYQKAIELEFEMDFILLLKSELNFRGIDPQSSNLTYN